MTPDTIKVDADRHLRLGLSAWDFRDEVVLTYSSEQSTNTEIMANCLRQ